MLGYEQFGKALLSRASEKGMPLCNLKLQKLAYYCQGYYLAVHDEPLFDGVIKAWTHGPVVIGLYHQYSMYRAWPITPPKEDVFLALSEKAQEMIDYVLNRFGQIEAWTLRNQTHTESPWLSHFDKTTGQVDGQVISNCDLKAYFSNELIAQQDAQFARILDKHAAIKKEELIEMPENIDTADDFVAWIKSR